MQQFVRDGFRKIGQNFGLVNEHVESTGMGQSGVDVRFSPTAKRIFGNLTIECKNTENLNVTGVFFGHAAKYPGSTPLLVHKRNNTEPLCTLRLSDFFNFLERGLNANKN